MSSSNSGDAAVIRPTRRSRLPVILLGVVVVVAAIWTGGWFFARARVATEMDLRLAALVDRGIEISCPERSIAGFPFRFEIGCDTPDVSLPGRGVSASTRRLLVVAQVWDPHLILADVDGPIDVASPAGRFEGKAARLRLSLRWSSKGLDRLSLEAEGVDASWHSEEAADLRLVTDHLELHARDDGERRADLDLALSTRGAVWFRDGRRDGPEKSDLDLALRLGDLLPLTPPEPARAFAARGGRIEPITLRFASAGLVFNGKGALRLLPDGFLDGSIAVAATGLERLALGAAKALGAEASGLAGGFVLLGKPSQDPDLPGRRLDLVVDHGRPRLGRVLFPQLAPLFPPLLPPVPSPSGTARP